MNTETLIEVQAEEAHMEREGAYKTFRGAYQCEYCNDTSKVLYDFADHNGEHVQHELPCKMVNDCQYKNRVW